MISAVLAVLLGLGGDIVTRRCPEASSTIIFKANICLSFLFEDVLIADSRIKPDRRILPFCREFTGFYRPRAFEAFPCPYIKTGFFGFWKFPKIWGFRNIDPNRDLNIVSGGFAAIKPANSDGEFLLPYFWGYFVRNHVGAQLSACSLSCLPQSPYEKAGSKSADNERPKSIFRRVSGGIRSLPLSAKIGIAIFLMGIAPPILFNGGYRFSDGGSYRLSGIVLISAALTIYFFMIFFCGSAAGFIGSS